MDETTVRALLAGKRWPHLSTRERLDDALGWPRGEIARRADVRPELTEFTTLELLAELTRRAQPRPDLSEGRS